MSTYEKNIKIFWKNLQKTLDIIPLRWYNKDTVKGTPRRVKKKGERPMGSRKKKNRRNESNLSKMAIVTATLSLLNGLITLITKIIELLDK